MSTVEEKKEQCEKQNSERRVDNLIKNLSEVATKFEEVDVALTSLKKDNKSIFAEQYGNLGQITGLMFLQATAEVIGKHFGIDMDKIKLNSN